MSNFTEVLALHRTGEVTRHASARLAKKRHGDSVTVYVTRGNTTRVIGRFGVRHMAFGATPREIRLWPAFQMGEWKEDR